MIGRAGGRISAILIAGPTASGKSSLAIAVAERVGGVVINADAMQVYRDLRILTARPSESDEERVPHTLYGVVDAATNYSVSRWLRDIEVELRAASETGRLAIVVGGTGLYFKALTQGLSAIPTVPEAVRSAVRRWAEGRPPEDLHWQLAKRDPATASRLRPTDPQRLLRALEVVEATGRGLSTYQEEREPPLLHPVETAAFVLDVERRALGEAIDHRFDAMVAAGAVAEVEALAQRPLDPALPVMRAHGVPSLLRYIKGTLDLAEATAEGKADTRRYVKRQQTFARTQLSRFHSVRPHLAEAAILAALDKGQFA